MWSDNQTLMAATGACGEGVAPGGPGYLANALAGSAFAANTCRIAAGGAVVDGHCYKNTANVDFNIPSSAGGTTRIDRIVARCVTASFTVRLFRIAGVDNVSPTPPAITQTPGATYDIMLYQVLVNSVGALVLTDERVFAAPLLSRQGGSPTDWSANGTTNYSTRFNKVETGTIRVAVGGGSNLATAGVTFPVAFMYPPTVQVSLLYATGAIAGDVFVPEVQSLTANGFTAAVRRTAAGAAVNFDVYWTATGPA